MPSRLRPKFKEILLRGTGFVLAFVCLAAFIGASGDENIFPILFGIAAAGSFYGAHRRKLRRLALPIPIVHEAIKPYQRDLAA